MRNSRTASARMTCAYSGMCSSRMRRRSTARARRPIRTLMMVPIAVRRNTGATASWMAREMSKMWGSTTMTSRARALALDAALHERVGERQEAHHHDAHDDRREVAFDPRDVAEE